MVTKTEKPAKKPVSKDVPAKTRPKVNIGKMRTRRAETSRGSDMIQLENGDTVFYVHPPCRVDDEHEPTTGLPYVPLEVHYNIGGASRGEGTMLVSLDKDANPIIAHPFVQEYLRKKGVKIKGPDPIAKWLENEATEEQEELCHRQTRYLWGLTPLRYRASSKDPWRDLTPKPSFIMCGPMIHDGIMEQFDELEDITDPDAAILIVINKKGVKKSTKYKVKADMKTARAPMKLPKAMRVLLDKATAKGGDCDLFRVVANFVKGTKEAEALLGGVELDDDDDDDKPRRKAASKPKTNKGKRDEDEDEEDEDEEDEDEEPEDEEDEDSEDEDEEDEDEDEEDEDEEDEDEDEEDEDEEDEDEEDEDSEDEDEEDEDEDEEDEDEDEEDEDEEPEPPKPDKKSKAEPKKAEPKKAEPKADKKAEPKAEEPDGLDDLDAELEKLSKANKKGKKATKAK